MDTKVTTENPFGHNRYGFAWEYVPQRGEAHLDFGCNRGMFLESLKGKSIKQLVGVDISRDAVAKAQRRLADHEIIHIRATVPLPFEDAQFTSITIIEVLEHVYEQKQLLDEFSQYNLDRSTFDRNINIQNIVFGNWESHPEIRKRFSEILNSELSNIK